MMNFPQSQFRSAPLQRGFTLIELIFALAIAAILVAIGVPSLGDMLASQRVRGTANDLFMDLSYARSEAIKRNANVQVVRTGGNWSGGWTVQVQASAMVLRSQPAVTGVTATNANDSPITFGPDGRSSVANALSFDFRSSGGGLTSMRCVSISPSGRPNVRADRNRNLDCADG